MSKAFLNPPGISTPGGYSHVVAVEAGKLIFLAGQVAYDAHGQLVGAGDLAVQTRQVCENLKVALAAAGATFEDVVKLTLFVVGYKPEDRATIAAVRDEYVPTQHPPASTLVGVQALARPELLIEIEAIAAVG